MAGLTVVQESELPWFLPSPEAQAERNALLTSQYFLVRIAGNGDVWKCKHCGAKHNYITDQCIERPFSGIDGGLYGYWYTININNAADALTEKDKERYERLKGIFGGGPDLASSHPQTARSIGTEFNAGDKGAFALGVLVGITKKDAQDLQDRINDTGVKPRLLVPGLRRNW
jgi:hypothetical protein